MIGAAKKIAYLMAHLSELIRGGKGTKRELIACAKVSDTVYKVKKAPPKPAIRMADIRRISSTSRMGSVNFANHIIRENICIY